jgi:hypothetical protein
MVRIPLGTDWLALTLTPRSAELGSAWQCVLLTLLLLAPAGLIVWLYRYERQLVRGWVAHGLLATRLLLVLLLWSLVGLQPSITEFESRVCVAVDLSASMDVVDRQRSADESAELARVTDKSPTEISAWSRKEIARRILATDGMDLLRRLARQHTVELFGFHETCWVADGAALDELFAPSSSQAATDLARPLQQAGQRPPPRGIVLLTDGRHNRGESPLQLAPSLGVPIYPVVVGSKRPPPDLVVLPIEAPRKVFKDTTLAMPVRVRATQLPEQEVTVEVHLSGKHVAPEHRRRIQHQGGDATHEVRFELPMEQVGTHTVKVQARASQEGEITLDNNQQTHVVRVVDEQARVLLVDDEARWEYHYVAGALGRDPKVRLDRVLFAPPRLGFVKPDEIDRAGLPRTQLPELGAGAADPLLDYDAIILGDVPPERLPPAERQRLERYVTERGGTLIVVAGKRAMPLSYTSQPDAATDRFVKMLPIRGPRVFERKDGFTLRLTDAGKRTPFLRLDSDAGPSGWPELPSHYWGIVGTRQPGATVLLAPATDASKEPPDEQTGLLVQHSFGFGTVLFLGLDSTWRWRYRMGDTLHHRFWSQLAMWAAAQRLLPAGNRVARYGSREPIYAHGQAVDVAVRLNADAPPLSHPEKAQVKLLRQKADQAEELAAVVLLTAGTPRGRLLEGTVRSLPAGTYRVALDIVELAPFGEEKGPAATFQVLPEASGELLDLSTDWELLAALAERSQGRLLTPGDVEEVTELLARQVQPAESVNARRTWEDAPWVWWTLGALVGLLTLEWCWRKRMELP